MTTHLTKTALLLLTLISLTAIANTMSTVAVAGYHHGDRYGVLYATVVATVAVTRFIRAIPTSPPGRHRR